MKPDIEVAWITSAVAIVSLAATVAMQLILHFLDKRAERKQELMQLRRQALHKALSVIDHVYANVEFAGLPRAKPHQWDIAEAWEAWNMMILYCANPRAATDAFAAAIGLISDMTLTPRSFGPADLMRFREVVATELGTPGAASVDPALVWITRLPGSGSAA